MNRTLLRLVGTGFALLGVYVLFEALDLGFKLRLLGESNLGREIISSDVSTKFQDFLTLTTGILVEAMPFIIMGVLFSVAIQKYLTQEMLLKLLPKHVVPRRMILSVLGMVMPVCECGNVPVARGLMVKGLSPAESMVFLLTAPSVNIVSIIVTWEAFSSINPWIAPLRVIGTIIIANITVVILSKLIGKSPIVTDSFAASCAEPHKKPPGYYTELFTREAWLMTRMLVFGASIAAITQVFVPREVLEAIGTNLLFSVVAMVVLAFVVSICSTVDAFFALAYAGTFTLGSILAFLVAGPMIDIKMIALMKTTYTTKAIAIVGVSVVSLTILLGVLFGYGW